jgi:septal ring factor EnvC (AmiA/AmiB activator)
MFEDWDTWDPKHSDGQAKANDAGVVVGPPTTSEDEQRVLQSEVDEAERAVERLEVKRNESKARREHFDSAIENAKKELATLRQRMKERGYVNGLD